MTNVQIVDDCKAGALFGICELFSRNGPQPRRVRLHVICGAVEVSLSGALLGSGSMGFRNSGIRQNRDRLCERLLFSGWVFVVCYEFGELKILFDCEWEKCGVSFVIVLF